MIGSRLPFRVGQRVKPSPEGIAANLFRRGKENVRGTVTKVDEFNSPTVLWDWRRTTASYHPDFIDPIRKK
jgi:hypothetical protein